MRCIGLALARYLDALDRVVMDGRSCVGVWYVRGAGRISSRPLYLPASLLRSWGSRITDSVYRDSALLVRGRLCHDMTEKEGQA
jgi:hypothetical protein